MKVAGIELDLAGYKILPGLINAHDHLEFSLFPRLGRGPYPNATAWAEDIYHPEQPPIEVHLRLAKRSRLLWGGLKNLLSGVTTVCHHNPYETLFNENFPVRVVQRFGWAHSLQFSPDLAARFRDTPPDWPFIIHLAEGTDAEAAKEVFRLHELGALDHRTVLVHAVGLNRAGLDLVRAAGASIVWCPSSNLFALGQTLKPEVFESGIPLALGTDSPITGHGDLLDEMCLASRLTEHDIRSMVTTAAAGILRLSPTNDFIAVRDFGQPPDLVVIDNQIKLIAPVLATQLPDGQRFHQVRLDGRPPALVDVDIPKLHAETTQVLGSKICLGGKEVQV